MASKRSLNKFVVRYAVRQVFKNAKGENESVIVLTDKRTVCNGQDGEQVKFFAKIGGILNLQDLLSANAKNILERVDVFGYYIVMANHRSYIGFNSYPLMMFNSKVPAHEQTFAPFTSFLPRLNGSTGDIVCAMRIGIHEPRGRLWTRYVGNDKSNPKGFVELSLGYVYDNDHKISSRKKYVGFYVGKNTSLLMYDFGSIAATKETTNDYNRTLFQEGAFVYADADILFRLCHESQVKLYTSREMYDKFKDTNVIGSDRYKKSHIVRENDPKKRAIIIFLKSTPFLLPFELHVTNDMSKDPLFKGKRIVILNIPSGGEFEYCEYWELKDGIRAVNERQSKLPWNSYIEKITEGTSPTFEEKITDIPLNSFPTMQPNEKTLQNEELFKKIRKVRKGSTGRKGGTQTTNERNNKEATNQERTNQTQTNQSANAIQANQNDNNSQEDQSQSPDGTQNSSPSSSQTDLNDQNEGESN